MTRIIPPAKFNLTPDIPKWMNPGLVTTAGKKDREEINRLTKKAAAPNRVIASYFCIDCNKVIQASNNAFIKQATIARRSNIEFKPECPNCGKEVKPYQVIEAGKVIDNIHSMNQEKKVDLQRISSEESEKDEEKDDDEDMEKESSLQKQASSKGVYNTFIDQKIVYKVVESLGKYASKSGMTGCRARYLKSEHRKEAGSDTSVLNDIECNLEWMYGRNQKGNATAKASIDIAGKITLPKVFKVASGMEYPFEEKYIRQIEREPALFNSMPSLKKSDTITFRRPDPTRFHSYASKTMKVGDYKKNVFSINSTILKLYAVPISGNERFPKGGVFLKGTLDQIKGKLQKLETFDTEEVDEFIKELFSYPKDKKGLIVMDPDDVEAFVLGKAETPSSEFILAVLDAFGGEDNEEDEW